MMENKNADIKVRYKRKYVLFVLIVFGLWLTANLSYACSDEIEAMQEEFIKLKRECPSENLSYDYAVAKKADLRELIVDCVSTGKDCSFKCSKFEESSLTCLNKPTSDVSGVKMGGSMVDALDHSIAANNMGVACLEGALSDCGSLARSAKLVCSQVSERVFRINDQCDIDFTNLAIRLRGLECKIGSSGDKTTSNQALLENRHELLQKVVEYGRKSLQWGRQINDKIMENRVSCSTALENNVNKKNEGVKSLIDASRELDKSKRSLGSE